MKTYLKFLTTALFLLLPFTQQIRAQEVIYYNDFATPASISDWTLQGDVLWNNGNSGQLIFTNNIGYVFMPALPQDATGLVISISAIWGDYIYLYTSPDGVTYTNQGSFTGGNGVTTASKNMPDGTRYVEFQSDYGKCLISVTVTRFPCEGSLPVSGISLNKTSTSLPPNATEKLVAYVAPACAQNKGVLWSSSDNSVVTVNSSGLVSPVSSSGTAIITATTIDGGFTAQCEVMVEITVVAQGECGAQGNNLSWVLTNDGTLTISGTGDMNDFGYCFGGSDMPWRFYLNQIRNLIIGSEVTSIGQCAFPDFNSLTSVTIPESVTSIGLDAFSGCSGLTTINFNAINCTSVSNYSFYQCNAITALNIGNNVKTIPDGAFSNLSGVTSVTIPNSVASIGSSAFSGCTGLASVTIPNSVTSIGSYAFYGCIGLTSVTIPNSITTIEDYTFSGCSALTFLTIPNSVTTIDDGAFYNCSSLTSVTIPENVTSIGSGAFMSVKTVNFNSINCTYSNGAFSGVTEINFGNKVTTIPAGAFNYSSLKSVTISASVTSIGNNAFANCSALSQIIDRATVPQTINANVFDYIDNTACVLLVPSGSDGAYRSAIGWRDFNNIRAIILPTGISLNKTTLALATGGAEKLQATVLPANADFKNIVWTSNRPDIAMVNEEGCVLALAAGTATITVTTQEGGFAASCTVTVAGNICSDKPIASGVTGSVVWTLCPNGTLTINGDAMPNYSGTSPWSNYRDSITKVVIGESVTAIGNLAFAGCTALTTVDFNAVNCSYMGYLASGQNLGNPWVDDERAFAGCGNITQVNIGNNVKIIPTDAFSSQKLTTVTIPESVEIIGSRAFGDNSQLTTINFNAVNCSALYSDISNPDGILSSRTQASAFNGCENLNKVNFGDKVTVIPDMFLWGCTGLASVTIPNSVTTIGSATFSGCTGLTTVTIPNSVTMIGNAAFSGCTGLTTVTIPENVTTIGYGAYFLGSSFGGCTGLTTVNFNAINYSGGRDVISVFFGCESLSTVNFGDKVTVIPSDVFSGCTGLVSVTIPNSVTTIDYQAFRNCSNLTNVTIGNGVTTIGDQAFSGCQWINSISLPNSVTIIGSSTFEGCSRLSSINIPYKVTAIEDYAFYGCALTSVTIPNSVTTIGFQAFYGCSNLTDLSIGSGVTTIGYQAFGYSSLASLTVRAEIPPVLQDAYNHGPLYVFDGVPTDIPVYVPCGTLEAYRTANQWSNFTNYIDDVTTTISYEAVKCYGVPYTDEYFSNLIQAGAYSKNVNCNTIANLTLTEIPEIPVTNYSEAILPGGSYTDNNFTNLTVEGTYSITLQSVNGCDSIVTLDLRISTVPVQQICMITVDEDNHNEVVWKLLDEVESYNIYRESAQSGLYDLVANVGFNEPNSWVDMESNARVRSYRYKISAIDNGSESALSTAHKTMHLTINAGIGNSWNLIWTPYEGMDYSTYNIYRATGETLGELELIGSIPAGNTSYSDFNAPANGYVYYVVEIVMAQSCEVQSLRSSSLTNIRSNIATNNPAAFYVTDITLNKPSTTLTIGATEQLTATVLPTDATNQNVTWSSSAPSVATVTNGLITALSAGTTTITVTTQEGDFSTQCVVTVTPNGTSIEKVSVNSLKAWVQNNSLYVNGLTAGQLWRVYNITGMLVYQNIADSEEANIPLFIRGTYFVQSGNRTVKIVY